MTAAAATITGKVLFVGQAHSFDNEDLKLKKEAKSPTTMMSDSGKGRMWKISIHHPAINSDDPIVANSLQEEEGPNKKEDDQVGAEGSYDHCEFPHLVTAKTFDMLLDDGKFDEAARLLVDKSDDTDSPEFRFSNPLWSMSKQQWLQEFPKLHKTEKPIFEAFQLELLRGGSHKHNDPNGPSSVITVTRKGKKKIPFLGTIHLMETYEFTKDGKQIKSITAARA